MPSRLPRVPRRRIASVSGLHLGNRHGLAIRREEAKLPRSARKYADSPCQGHECELAAVEVSQKKPKGGERSAEETTCNRGLGNLRVVIEHRIGCTRRLRIVAGRVNIAAGLAIVGTAKRYVLDPNRRMRQSQHAFATGPL